MLAGAGDLISTAEDLSIFISALLGGKLLPAPLLADMLTPHGTLVLVGVGSGGMLAPVPRMLHAALLSIGSSRRIRSLIAVPKPEMTAALIELARAGRIAPVIERTYSFAQADMALAHVEAGHTVGKVVVRVE